MVRRVNGDHAWYFIWAQFKARALLVIWALDDKQTPISRATNICHETRLYVQKICAGLTTITLHSGRAQLCIFTIHVTVLLNPNTFPRWMRNVQVQL
jgi:hypothetical protein